MPATPPFAEVGEQFAQLTAEGGQVWSGGRWPSRISGRFGHLRALEVIDSELRLKHTRQRRLRAFWGVSAEMSELPADLLQSENAPYPIAVAAPSLRVFRGGVGARMVPLIAMRRNPPSRCRMN
jgi:hypothetical protein